MEPDIVIEIENRFEEIENLSSKEVEIKELGIDKQVFDFAYALSVELADAVTDKVDKLAININYLNIYYEFELSNELLDAQIESIVQIIAGEVKMALIQRVSA